MKGMFSKLGLKSVLAVFVLMMAMTFSTKVGAQTFTGSGGPAINWLSEQDAISKLKVEIENRHTALPAQVVNSATYNDNIAHIAMYKSIYRQLSTQSGSVPAAVNSSLGDAATLGGTQEAGAMSKATLHNLYEDAKSLLSN
jgi:hypothetical protein